MSRSMQRWGKPVFCLVSAVVLAASWSVGCGGVGPGEFIGSPFRTLSDGGTTGTGADGAGGTGGAAFGGDTRAATDACDEPQNRKFVRISMRNLSGDHVHYFLVLVAFIQGETFPEGAAVCPDDVALYTSFGYLEIGDGELREFGNFCIAGPALLYFHESGQFQTARRDATGLGHRARPGQQPELRCDLLQWRRPSPGPRSHSLSQPRDRPRCGAQDQPQLAFAVRPGSDKRGRRL